MWPIFSPFWLAVQTKLLAGLGFRQDTSQPTTDTFNLISHQFLRMKPGCVSSIFSKGGLPNHNSQPRSAPCSQEGKWPQSWTPTTHQSQCGTGFIHLSQRKLWPERGYAMVGKPRWGADIGASNHRALTPLNVQMLHFCFCKIIVINYVMVLLKESKETVHEKSFVNLKYHPVWIIKLSWVQFYYFLLFRALRVQRQ